MLAGEAKAALAAIVIGNGGSEIGFGKVGPKRGRENELGVGGLHQKEVADTGLAGGADHEVGIGEIGGGEVAGESGPRIVVEILPAGGNGGGVGAGGVNDLGAGSVVKRENKGVIGEVLRGGGGVVEQLLDIGREVGGATDGAETDAIADEGGEFLLEVVLEQPHEPADLVLGAFPVFDRKGVKREDFHAEVSGRKRGGANGFDSPAVPFQAG